MANSDSKKTNMAAVTINTEASKTSCDVRVATSIFYIQALVLLQDLPKSSWLWLIRPWTYREVEHKLTQFTLPALEPGCAAADEGVASVHTRTSVLAGQTAAVLGRLYETTAAINILSSGFRLTLSHYPQLMACVDSLQLYPHTTQHECHV